MNTTTRALSVTLLLFLGALAPVSAIDPNERVEALRHLQIIRKEAGILTRLAATATATPPTPAADPRSVSAALSRAADALTAAVESEDPKADLEALYDELDTAADAIEPAVPSFPPKGGVYSRLANVRWSVGRVAPLIGLQDEHAEKFTVGAVTLDQAEVLVARIDALLERAVVLSAKLNEADPAMMYRDLLRSQLSAFIDPSAILKVAVKSRPPWWTFDAYQAVSKITRLVALTKTEVRKLTPELLELLKQVWTASEELEAAANDIEHGARASGPDAQIEYVPAPKGR